MLTSRPCSCKLRRGLTSGGAATSQTLMLPSPQADARMFSFSCHNRSVMSTACCRLSPQALLYKVYAIVHQNLCQRSACAAALCGTHACSQARTSHQPQSQMPSFVSYSATGAGPCAPNCTACVCQCGSERPPCNRLAAQVINFNVACFAIAVYHVRGC